jgi:predicted RNA polymerase sigma factor
MTAADIHRTILAVWRIEQPRLITSLSRTLCDVPMAEDLTQEALLAALEHWPTTGVPDALHRVHTGRKDQEKSGRKLPAAEGEHVQIQNKSTNRGY